MVGGTSSIKGVIAELPTHILPKIERELTREVLIDQHRLISGNAASVVLNLGGGCHKHIALTMTA